MKKCTIASGGCCMYQISSSGTFGMGCGYYAYCDYQLPRNITTCAYQPHTRYVRQPQPEECAHADCFESFQGGGDLILWCRECGALKIHDQLWIIPKNKGQK